MTQTSTFNFFASIFTTFFYRLANFPNCKMQKKNVKQTETPILLEKLEMCFFSYEIEQME